jgi:hypothetical protein
LANHDVQVADVGTQLVREQRTAAEDHEVAPVEAEVGYELS